MKSLAMSSTDTKRACDSYPALCSPNPTRLDIENPFRALIAPQS
jgi:hypothetical protein